MSDGLEDFEQKLDQLLAKFPQARRDLVNDCTDKLEQKVLENVNQITPRTGNLKRGVKKALGSQGGYGAIRADYSIAPHAHLVENGHYVRNRCGWVPGRHMFRNARNSLANELEQDAEQMYYKLVGDLFD